MFDSLSLDSLGIFLGVSVFFLGIFKAYGDSNDVSTNLQIQDETLSEISSTEHTVVPM